MPVLMQVCVVIVTMALVLLAFATLRTMRRFEEAAKEVAETADAFQSTVTDLKQTSGEIRELIVSLEEFTTGLKSTAARFEAVGDRAADISNLVLNEIEGPVRRAAGLVRGIKVGTGALFHRWTGRPTATTHANGGNDERNP